MGRSENLRKFHQCGMILTSSLLLVVSLFPRQGLSQESSTLMFSEETPKLLTTELAQINIPPQVPQPDPNKDRFLPRPPSPPKPEPPPNPELTPTPTPPPPTPPPDETPIPVQTINVTGSTILTSEEIQTLVTPLENRSVTLTQLRELADQITAIYLERG